jgi:hypothetical protein
MYTSFKNKFFFYTVAIHECLKDNKMNKIFPILIQTNESYAIFNFNLRFRYHF